MNRENEVKKLERIKKKSKERLRERRNRKEYKIGKANLKTVFEWRNEYEKKKRKNAGKKINEKAEERN